MLSFLSPLPSTLLQSHPIQNLRKSVHHRTHDVRRPQEWQHSLAYDIGNHQTGENVPHDRKHQTRDCIKWIQIFEPMKPEVIADGLKPLDPNIRACKIEAQ